MLLNDLIGLPVTTDERRVGYVNDVRFVLDGPPDGHLARARLHGLVVSPHRRGSFLGYERTAVDRPRIVNSFLARRHAGSALVLWPDVSAVDPDGVRLVPGYRAYDPRL